jgi:hypothetical protein
MYDSLAPIADRSVAATANPKARNIKYFADLSEKRKSSL